MKKSRSYNELIAVLIGLLAAFLVPILAVNLAGDNKFNGAVVLTSGLKNLGLGDMTRGIGVCGLLGLVAALIVSLAVFFLLSRLRRS